MNNEISLQQGCCKTCRSSGRLLNTVLSTVRGDSNSHVCAFQHLFLRLPPKETILLHPRPHIACIASVDCEIVMNQIAVFVWWRYFIARSISCSILYCHWTSKASRLLCITRYRHGKVRLCKRKEEKRPFWSELCG